jgi:hypothetical protein
MCTADNTYTVNNSSDSGPGSLRQAIIDANAAGLDTINFDSNVFPSASPVTITIKSSLPALTDNDGTIIEGNGGVIITGDTNTFVGMTISSSNNIIRGLQLNGLRLGIEFDRLTVNSYNIIGGTAPAQRNIISNNLVAGISLTGANTYSNIVIGNYIGLNAAGTAAFGSQSVGIDLVRGAHDNIIGGTTPAERNIISGNTFAGIRLDNFSSEGITNNNITGNYIGTDFTGMNAIPNNSAGITFDGAVGNIIGGTVAGAGNLISGNTGHGIRLSNTIGSGNFVFGNIIGLTADGTTSLPNGDGINMSETDNNVIGGPSAGARNIISGNNYNGIRMYGNSSGNMFEGNYIGTDPSGTISIGNEEEGIRIVDAPDNIVGGTATGAGNLISGNERVGILISNSGAIGNQILGNFIGTDVSGTVALANGSTGISVDSSASNNIIGGTTTGAGNLVSGNQLGIAVRGGSENNQILGNLIGTDVTGTVGIGNLKDGVTIHNSPNNSVGGVAHGARNIISGNGDDGLSILEPNAFGNQVTGNYIGTDVNGVNVIGNLRGVQISNAPNNTVDGNLIHYNTSYGVLIQGDVAVSNTLTQNSITANGEGIPDRGILIRNGANLYIPAPAITDVTASQVVGTSTSPNSSTIEIFQDTGDQGNIYIGAATVLGGAFAFTGTPPPNATGGNLTATVTDPAGNTSEFSTAVPNDLSAATASVWRIETVDDSLDDFSKSASLALDAFGNPHISYRAHLTGGYHDLKYAAYDGSNWHIEIIDPGVYAGNFTSIAVDEFNNSHFSYDDFGNLEYAHFDGAWNTQTVDSLGRVGSNSSIAIDSIGGLHISYDDYTDNTNANLKYAFCDEGSWNIETVDSDGSVGFHTSVVVDSSDLPCISYLDWDNSDIKYARYDGSNWEIDVVDTGDYNWFSALALDSADNPHVSYFSQRENWWSTELRYAYHNGTEWLIQTVDRTSGGYGTYTSIALDSSGHPHISYDMGGATRYAYFDGSSWHIETVDSEGWTGYYNSIALNASDSPRISYLTYYDANNAALMYAQRTEIGLSDSATVTTSEGDMTVSISEGSFAVTPKIVDPGAALPDGFLTPYGAVSFTISTDPGATVTVIITLPEEPPIGTTIFKCLTGVCSPITGATISGNQVVFDVTDGGSLDEDFKVNGKIVEPSVLAVPAHPEVAVDIKPGSCPNPINVNSRGVLPIAILGTNDLNVTTIDPGTIRLAGISPLRWALEDVATPYEPFIGKQTANDCTVAGPDGLTDFTLKFNTQELAQSLKVLLGRELEDGEAVVARLSGNLREAHGSAAFLGEDVVVVLRKGKK